MEVSVHQTGTGGSAYDGRQQVLYWADVMSEIAFVVPSAEMYNRYLADPHGGKFTRPAQEVVPMTVDSRCCTGLMSCQR